MQEEKIELLKELIINSDYDYYAYKNSICYASNNSNENSWEYRLLHNCEWQVAFDYDKSVQSFDYDVDFLCIAKRKSNKANDSKDLVFWNNAYSENRGIIMMGDNIGGACPPDEGFWVDFGKIDSDVIRIDFLMTLYFAENKDISFSSLIKLRTRIIGDKKELMLGEESSNVFQYDYTSFPCDCSVVKLGCLIREKGGWRYKPTTEGFNINLKDVIKTYGFDV